MQLYTLTNLLVTLEHGPSKGWAGVHLLYDNASSHKCEVVKSFLASEKVKVLNHPLYSPDLSPCDFLSHLLVAGCDIGVDFPSVRLSTFMSKFDIYVKVSILINYKTKQPSNLA